MYIFVVPSAVGVIRTIGWHLVVGVMHAADEQDCKYHYALVGVMRTVAAVETVR